MIDSFYDYIRENKLFKNKSFKVICDYGIQKVQEKPEVFLLFSENHQLYLSEFSLKVFLMLTDGKTVGDIMNEFQYSNSLLDGISETIQLLRRKDFIEAVL